MQQTHSQIYFLFQGSHDVKHADSQGLREVEVGAVYLSEEVQFFFHVSVWCCAHHENSFAPIKPEFQFI